MFRREWPLYITSHSKLYPAALAPGQVQNLRSTLDPDTPTLTLKWDKPKNMVAVKSYDIRFQLCGRKGKYCMKTVVPPATSIILRRESGLKALTKYTFEVRAQSVSREGKWSELCKYIGKCLFVLIVIIFY